MEVKLIGMDIAKTVFQICGIDDRGEEVLRKRLRRGSVLRWFASQAPATVALEACATSHYWGRELMALGHRVRLLPPRYVKSYVWRNKTDAADALAICRAAGDPGLHDVPVKSVENQAVLALHRSRELLVRQRTMLGNALRAHLAEFGIVAAQGRAGLHRLLDLAGAGPEGVPVTAWPALEALAAQWGELSTRIAALEKAIVADHKTNAMSRRLATIPGIGPLTASALAARVDDAGNFRSGRHLAAWLGLTPREHASGLKRRRGGIGKQGDAYLRRLLVLGAHSRMRRHKADPGADPWLAALRERRPAAVAAVALANKTARIAWAVMSSGEDYNPHRGTAA